MARLSPTGTLLFSTWEFMIKLIHWKYLAPRLLGFNLWLSWMVLSGHEVIGFITSHLTPIEWKKISGVLLMCSFIFALFESNINLMVLCGLDPGTSPILGVCLASDRCTQAGLEVTFSSAGLSSLRFL